MHQDQKRVRYLDGLRGVAAVGVVLTHLLYEGTGRNGTHFMLFGDRYANLPPMRAGWVGVELFFMISGFVIFLTLQRCTGLVDFLTRRWLRLFPAMLIATLATFAFSHTLQPLVGLKNLPARDLLPGLTFVNPSFWHALAHVDAQSLEHAYWTLYVEVAFYVIFSLMYFAVGWRGAVVGLIAINLGLFVARPVLTATVKHGPLMRLPEPFEWLGCLYYLWFASGILFAKARELGSDRLFAIACGVAVAAVMLTNPNPFPTPWTVRLTLLSVAVLFTAAQRFGPLQAALEWRPLVFLGFISYPLYLLHQNIGLGIITHTFRLWPAVPVDLAALPAIAVVVLLAWGIARFIEPPIRNALLRGLCRLSIVRQTRSA